MTTCILVMKSEHKTTSILAMKSEHKTTSILAIPSHYKTTGMFFFAITGDHGTNKFFSNYRDIPVDTIGEVCLQFLFTPT